MMTDGWPILLLALAGPIVGSLLGITVKLSRKMICAMMGFAGGTMVAISLLEMLPQSIENTGVVGCVMGLIVGMLTIQTCDIFFFEGSKNGKKHGASGFEKTAIMMLIAIFVHNLPEGFIMAVNLNAGEQSKAIAVALAIAIHDIPEGYCTSAPYYYETGKKWRSFFQSVSTVIPVLVGFVIGRNLCAVVNQYTLGMVIAVAAGMMLWVSGKELIPTAMKEGVFIISLLSVVLGGVLVVVII